MTSQVFRDGILDGQVAIVTGGGSGLGRVSALELASLGAEVIVAGRRAEPLVQTAALRVTDASCPTPATSARRIRYRAWSTRRWSATAGSTCSSITPAGQFLSPAEDITPKGFRTVMKLNVEGTWLMTHAVATRAMIPAGGGKIVSVTLSPHQGLPGMAHSSAARAAVENLMRVLSIEWSRFNIKLNAIAAGQFATETLLTQVSAADRRLTGLYHPARPARRA